MGKAAFFGYLYIDSWRPEADPFRSLEAVARLCYMGSQPERKLVAPLFSLPR
jgi:hypothetical protein